MRLFPISGLTAALALVMALCALMNKAVARVNSAVQNTAAENLPAMDAAATETSPLVWLIPVVLGVFAFVLVFVIRRYSKPRHQDKAQEEIKKPGR